MPITIDNALGIHPQALTLRSQRAELLAANLANADTPNYKARDIDFKSVLSAAQGTASTTGSALPLAASNAAHIQPQATQSQAELLYRNPRQPAVDGNTVDSQVEYTEFARNALQYQASLTFLGGHIKTLLTAIRGD
jgi:flagellar basal-body rod protein FlgB